jgi:DNA-binding transcriptional ArsR family regulator
MRKAVERIDAAEARLVEPDDSTVGEALARAEYAIREAEIELRRAREAQVALADKHRREHASIERAIASLTTQLRQLRDARRIRRPAAQAGPAAIERVEAALRKGPLTQAQVIAVTGLQQGTVSYAISALREEGRVEFTGRRVERSRELRLVEPMAPYAAARSAIDA